jgi:hypothetical protein
MTWYICHFGAGEIRVGLRRKVAHLIQDILAGFRVMHIDSPRIAGLLFRGYCKRRKGFPDAPGFQE